MDLAGSLVTVPLVSDYKGNCQKCLRPECRGFIAPMPGQSVGTFCHVMAFFMVAVLWHPALYRDVRASRRAKQKGRPQDFEAKSPLKSPNNRETIPVSLVSPSSPIMCHINKTHPYSKHSNFQSSGPVSSRPMMARTVQASQIKVGQSRTLGKVKPKPCLRRVVKGRPTEIHIGW
jgi:hypothetical protein